MASNVPSLPDDNLVAVLIGRQGIEICDVETGKVLQAFKGYTNDIESTLLSPDGQMLASISVTSVWSGRGQVRGSPITHIWNTSDGKLLQILKGHGIVAFSPDSQMLFSADDENYRYFWYPAKGQLLEKFGDCKQSTQCGCAAFRSDGQIFIGGTGVTPFKFMDVLDGKLHDLPGGLGGGRSLFTVSPNGQVLAIANEGGTGTILFYDIDVKGLRSLKASADKIHTIAFSPNSQMLASGGDNEDKIIRLWDVASNKLLQKFEGHTTKILNLAWSGNFVLASRGLDDNVVRLWDATSGKLLQVQKFDKSVRGIFSCKKDIKNDPQTTVSIQGSNSPDISLIEKCEPIDLTNYGKVGPPVGASTEVSYLSVAEFLTNLGKAYEVYIKILKDNGIFTLAELSDAQLVTDEVLENLFQINPFHVRVIRKHLLGSPVQPVKGIEPPIIKTTPLKIIPFADLKPGKAIKEGSFGTAYLAEYHGSNVIYKELNKSEIHLWDKEAEILQHVGDTPRAVRYFGGVNESPHYGFVMEYYANGNIEEVLYRDKQNKFSNPKDALIIARMIMQAAAGLKHIHSVDVIHRDVAARNFLLDGQWQVYISDLGLARAVSGSAGETGGTKSQTGPVRWWCDEWCIPNNKGEIIYSKPGDVYSFGCFIFECYAREMPFAKLQSMEIVSQRGQIAVGARKRLDLMEMIPIGTQIPREILAVMKACLSYDPKDRPTMAEVYNEVRKYCQQVEEEKE